MKIAIIGSKTFDSLEYNLNEAFNSNGFLSRIFDIYDRPIFRYKCLFKYTNWLDWMGRRFSDSYDYSIFKKLAFHVKEYCPDLIVCTYRFIHPVFVKELKSSTCKIIHVNPDALTTFEYQQIFASEYDVYFTKDPYIVSFMKDKMKLNVKLYNEAFNIRIHSKPTLEKSVCEDEVLIDVLAYGTMYPYRCKMLSYLKKEGIEPVLFGVKPRFFDQYLLPNFRNSYITGKEKAKLLYGSKIVFNNFHYAEIESVNNKFFEINGSGGFQICDYRPILKDLLPIDPRLISFMCIEEGLEKIKYYLNHSQERYEIALKIYQYFVEHYTYDHLIYYILKNI